MDEDGKLGAGVNHERCYEWLAESDSPWVVILEDDAIPINHFHQQAARVLDAAPEGSGLVSLYLGRFRPPHWQPSIAQVIADPKANFFLAEELLHHVGVAIKTELIPGMMKHLRQNKRYRTGKLPIDEAIGQWTRSIKMPVAYSHPSIVNHDITLSTVIEKHVSRHKQDTGIRPSKEIREAWAFGSRKNWTSDHRTIPKP